MGAERKHIKFAVSMRSYGYNGSAWRHPDVPTGSGLDFSTYRKVAQTAERGMLDMVFLADLVSLPAGSTGRDPTNVGFEPLTLLSALVPHTRHIGLAATVSTTFQSPFHIARFFASLDHLSGGRAAWNVITSFREDEQQNFSADAILPKELRYDRAREAVGAVKALWGSWDADALIRDKVSGQYYDPTKVHAVDHLGGYFKVAGPLNLPRTPQERPVIIQAGASERGQELAAETAEVVYAAATELKDAQAFYASLKSKLGRFGRRPDDIKIMPGILPVVGETVAEAEAKLQQMKELIAPDVGISRLSAVFGDISAYDLDGPFPADIENRAAGSSRIEMLVRLARERNFSLRQLYQHWLVANNHHVVVGTPSTIADVMEEWFADGAADGFNIVPAFTHLTLTDFVDRIRPELVRRNLVRSHYEGTTLRENLGLPAIPRRRA